jgi:AcrR family transcriptional regulator
MDAIASKLGISKAALYTYFEDKEALFRATYESAPRDLEQMIESVIKQGDARKAFAAFFDEMMPDLRKGAESTALSFEVISESARNKELQKVLRKQFDQYIDAVERCVSATTRLQKENAKQMAGAITGLWYGMEMLIALGYPIDRVRTYWNNSMAKLLAP